jgi:hypothetical protein
MDIHALQLMAVPPFESRPVIDLPSPRPSNVIKPIPTTDNITQLPIDAQIIHSEALPNDNHSQTPALPPVSVHPRMFTKHVTAMSQHFCQIDAKKPLRTLSSFLGGFLETARNAKQVQASTSTRIGEDGY